MNKHMMGKHARVLLKGLEGMEVLKGLKGLKGLKVLNRLKKLKPEGGVCNEWIINKGWACFLYIVYI